MIDLVIGVVILSYGLVTGTHALMTKRDPRSSLGWTVLCVLVPALGATFYWLFGVNRIKTRARRWQKGGLFTLDVERGGYAGATTKVDAEHPARAETLSALTRISERVTRKPLLRGNRIEPLHNGEGAYPLMLEAIRGAKESVYLCTYLFEADDTGMQFVEALIDAGARGVDVRVLVDAIGERYGPGSRVSRLLHKRKGVKVARFLPLAPSLRGLRVNLRNHRKILTVDSEVGFTGGMNIGGRNMVQNPQNKHTTADLHFRVAGPVVYTLEETFFEDWFFTTGEQPNWDDNQDVPTAPAGDAMCRGISDGPNEDFEALTWILVGALSAARSRVQIMTPYFIPSRELLSALNAAVLRGVQVDVLLPAKNNLPFVAWASQAMLDEVLRYGTNVYYQAAPFNHSKLFIVDEFYVLLGSANLDPRSLRLNFEFNLEVYDDKLGAELSGHFERARTGAQPITIESLESRHFLIKLRDSIARLFSPYL